VRPDALDRELALDVAGAEPEVVSDSIDLPFVCEDTFVSVFVVVCTNGSAALYVHYWERDNERYLNAVQHIIGPATKVIREGSDYGPDDLDEEHVWPYIEATWNGLTRVQIATLIHWCS
jgi:hypothetical protein